MNIDFNSLVLRHPDDIEAKRQKSYVARWRYRLTVKSLDRKFTHNVRPLKGHQQQNPMGFTQTKGRK
jgi:hypothetical protein